MPSKPYGASLPGQGGILRPPPPLALTVLELEPPKERCIDDALGAQDRTSAHRRRAGCRRFGAPRFPLSHCRPPCEMMVIGRDASPAGSKRGSWLRRLAGQHGEDDMEISKVGVVGAGTMGNGIAQAFATSGYDVAMRDIKQEFVDRGMSTIKKSLERLASRNKITGE